MIRWLALQRRLSGDGGASIGNACPPMTSPPAPPGNVPTGSGNAGENIGLVGHGFGPDRGTIHVGSHSATVTAWTDTYVEITLPDQADFAVVTTITLTRTDGHTATLPAFLTDTASLAAHISSLSAAGGPAGLTVTITGTHFEAAQGTGGVTFHGVAAAVSNWSDTAIIATVPAQGSYPDTGNVVLTTGEGSVSNGVSFETVPDPSLTSLNHATGQPGDSLILTGTHFLAAQGAGSVLVDGVAATVTAWAETSVTVTVPSQGPTSASYPAVGIVTLTTNLGRSTPELKAYTTTVPTPSLASLNHANGQPGDSLTLTGTFFGAAQGAGSVTVDGVAATVTAWAEASVTVTVPSQGATSASYPVSGTVVLTTNDGLASNPKAYTTTVPNPVIASLSAGTGQANSTLTLTGTFFGAAQGGSGGVTVHGTVATVTSWGETSVAITVPTFGSYPDTGNVVLTTDGLLQSNGQSFITTAPATAVHMIAGSLTRCELLNAAFNAGAAGSLAIWVKIDAGMGATLQPFCHYDPSHFGFLFQISAAGAGKVRIISPGAAISDTPTLTVSTGTWHLLVGAYDASGVYFSLDGGAYVSGSNIGNPYTGLTWLSIGSARGDTGSTAAAYDNAGYWGKKLSAGEVASLYNSGHGLAFSGLAGSLLTNLVCYYNCDDTGGANLVDASGAGLTLLGQNSTSTYTSVAGVP